MTKRIPKAAPLHVEPEQQRSRQSMERILRATESLLESRPFSEITVQDIVRRARASVGTFYARFRDKDALLPLLYDRQGGSLDREREALGSARPKHRSLARAAEYLVREMVSSLKGQQHLMRAIALYTRANQAAMTDEQRRPRSEALALAHEILLDHREEIGHPRPDEAVRFGLFFVGAACREKLLFEHAAHAASIPATDEALVHELTRALLAYLKS